MPASDLVRNLILVYAISLAAIVFLARLRVPPVVAMVAAGILAGPAGFGLVAQEQVDALAELGVIFLLFTVGLDFSLAELRRTLGRMVLAGLLQIAATALAVGAMGLALGLALPTAIFAGLFVALSSTAIVLKTLADRNALASPAARLATGVLLFQDLAVVVLLLLLPVLAGRTAGGGTVDLLVRGGLALGLVAAVARLVLPRLLRFVLGSGRREAFPLAILVASVGTAWASAQLGVPMAIGAFLGGLVIAESEFCHQAHAEVRPLRDVLSALFFVSLGLLVEARFVVTHVGTVVGLTILVVAVKAVTATVALLPLAPVRIAATAGLYLAQVGEFSFILGRAALALGIVGEPVWQALLAASIGSMLLAAPIVAAAPALTARLARERRRGAARPAKMPASGHVLVLGFGVGGRLVATTLRELGIEYVVLELNGRTVRAARREGEPILYGDATSPESLRRAGLEQARAVVALLSDPDATLRAVRAARAVAPAVPVIARVRYRLEAERLIREGATIAVAEELEASFEVLGQLLVRLDLPANVVDILLADYRRGLGALRTVTAPPAALADLPPVLVHTPVVNHRLEPGDWAVGRTIAEVDLRARTGALVLAIRRGDRHVTSPPADLPLAAGDILYLVGDESSVLLARHRLAQGEPA